MVLLTVGVITLALLAQFRNLTVIIDPDETLPQAHPFVIATNEVEHLFGSKYTLMITVSPHEGNALQPLVQDKIKALTADLLAAPGVVKSSMLSLAVRKAKSITGTDDGLVVRPLLEKGATSPEKLERTLKDNPVFLNMVVSDDFRAAAIIVEFKKSADGFAGIENTVRSIISRHSDSKIDIDVAGQPLYLSLLERYSGRMIYLVPLSILIIGLIHFEAFRTVQGLILPLVTALFALIWALGLMSLAHVPLDAFNATTPILILAVAAGHAVQILKRYYEDYNLISDAPTRAEANRRAVIRSLARIGPVMVAACLVAAGSFLSLLFFDIRTIRTFGLFSSVGIASILIIELTFIPALRSLLPAPGLKEAAGGDKAVVWNRIIAVFIGWLAPGKRGRLLTAAAGFAVVMAALGSQVRIDNALRSNFFPSVEAVQEDAKVNDRLGGTNTLYVLIKGGAADAIKSPSLLRDIEATQDFLRRQPSVGKVISITDFIRKINQSMNGGSDVFDAIPDSPELISQYLLLYSMAGDPTDFASYVDDDYRNALIRIYVKDESSAVAEPLERGLEEFVKGRFPGCQVSIGGNLTAMMALTEVMVDGQMHKIIVISMIVLLISAILFRSLITGILVLVPLAMTVLTSLGIMGASGIPLNVATSVSIALAVGIGADYAIYLTYRLKEYLDMGEPEDLAIRNTLSSAGKAILFVATAVSGGYAVLLFSYGFNIHVWIALLIGAAMLVSSLSALTIFPALLLTLRPTFLFGGRQTPPPAARIGAIMMLALVVGTTPANAETPAAGEIASRTFLSNRVQDSRFEARFKLIDSSGAERVRETTGQTRLKDRGEDSLRLTRFLSPADIKGTAVLMVENSGDDDDMWIYLPALKKVRRLVASDKRDSFIGTDFSFGDIIGHKAQEWNHTLVREETVDGRDCFVLESIPASAQVQADSGYAKRIGWIRQDNFVTIRGEFYDEDGRLLKQFRASDLQQVDPSHHKWQPMRLEMLNVQTEHKTVIEFRHFEVNQGIDAAQFSPRRLETP